MRRRPGAAAVLAGTAAGAVALAVLVAGAPGGSAETALSQQSREELARSLLAKDRDRYSTQALTRALRAAAGLDSSPGRSVEGSEEGDRAAARSSATPLARAGLRNVLVNDPSTDTHQVDQTTQSETTLAVSGRHVAVGFNDSQQVLFTLTDAADLSGYAWSDDGGATFTDGGALPNPAGFVNLGDPWMGVDRGGRLYYATLTLDGEVGNLEIGVAHSDDGGHSWTRPAIASPADPDLFYLGDKENLTVGRSRANPARDTVYVAWDDVSFGQDDSGFTGLPVARSTDRGRTWSLHYASRLPTDTEGCGFAQYIGAQPLVNPGNGRLYVAAEKIEVDDPQCEGGEVTFSEVLTTSDDGGTTFGPVRTIARVSPASPTGAIELAPGKLVRTVEFPSMVIRRGVLHAAWNDGSTGRSHLRLATSTNGGRTWTVRDATRGTGDEIQPALSVDAAGLHLAYYQRNQDNSLDTVLADSSDGGTHWSARRVTSRSFPGVPTVPQFDPQIAPGYMGDYIANVSAGGHLYLAWGDNRNVVRTSMHPHGRHDPDVFFARR